jgi:hypothetical protein
VEIDDASRRPVQHRDVEVMIGILAITLGNLLGGQVDDKEAAKLSARFVDSGLLETDRDGNPPSAGRAARAMDALILRLQFALGEYDSETDPVPEGTAHLLRFSSEAEAASCVGELRDSAIRVRVEPDPDTGDALLYAVYAELAPDPGFWNRERGLQAMARRFGAAYIGSQSAYI